MYRCKECSAKYKIKPDYCDCGNDTFEEISQGSSLEQKSEIFSKIIFVICLIISVIVWLIPVKTAPRQAKAPAVQTAASIPDIDKIWNSTPAYQPKVEVAATPKQLEPIKLTPIPQRQTPQTPTTPKTIEKQVQPVSKPIQKPVEKVQPVQQPKQETVKPAEKKAETKPVQKTEPAQKPEPKAIQPPKIIEQTKPVYNPNSPEMLKYKTNLRAAMFSKFAVGSIQGSGTCSISFSVDSTGKLINRKFTKESDNKSLNDTVYYMLMRVPRFSPPPAGYNGETIRMNFTINNGNYEISIY